MHEYSIVQALLDRVAIEARQRSALSVSRLWISIGELSGVDAGLLRTAYVTFSEGTVCERAPLEIARIEPAWACPACDRPIPRGERLECTACGTPARLLRGDEIMLDRIELEVG